MRAVVRIDHRCLWITPHSACSEKVYAELLLPCGETPLFLCPSGGVDLMGPLKQPIGKLQIVRMILVGHAQSGQAPSVFQFWIQREAVVLDWQRSAMAGDFHGAREIVCQGGLEILTPSRRSRRETAHRKTDGCEIDSRVKSAPAVESDLLWIEFVEIVQYAANGVALVFVEGMLVQAGYRRVGIEHKVFANDPARIREAVRKLFIRRKQKQSWSLGAVGANDYCLGPLQMYVALLIEVHGTGRAAVRIRL